MTPSKNKEKKGEKRKKLRNKKSLDSQHKDQYIISIRKK